MENITASEVAGLGVGALLLCATIAAPKIDSFISASQRRLHSCNFAPAFCNCTPAAARYRAPITALLGSLGMCKRCGDLKLVACSTCKGVGSVNSSGFFGFTTEDRTRMVKCTRCQARGHFTCPDCS